MCSATLVRLHGHHRLRKGAARQALPGDGQDVEDTLRLRQGDALRRHHGGTPLEGEGQPPQDVRLHIHGRRRDARRQARPAVLHPQEQPGQVGAYITTDMKLEFGRAFRIYSMRWAIEVCNYDKYFIM